MTTIFNLRNKVSEALQSNKLIPQHTTGNDFFITIKVRIEGEMTLTALKRFKAFLEKEKLRYASSFSSRLGIMNISIYSY